jgi:hypothetical protein
VKSGRVPITRQKDRLVNGLSHSNKNEGLKALYTSIMENAIFDGHSQESEITEDLRILYTIISLGKPLSCNAIAELMSINVDLVQGLIDKLQAVLFTSAGSNAIFTFHASFPDFIEKNLSTSELSYDASICHYNLSISCFQVMGKLQFNMCKLPSSFIPDAEVEGINECIKEAIGESLQYSCQFWTFHLMKYKWNGDVVSSKLEEFVREKGIYWVEAMSLINQLQECGEALQQTINVCRN